MRLTIAAGLALAAAVNAGAVMTNEWETAGAKSVRFEVRFLDPKAQVRVYRKCDERKPRVRIDSGMTLLPFCFRGGTWNAEKGRSEWNGAQLNVGELGYGAEAFYAVFLAMKEEIDKFLEESIYITT